MTASTCSARQQIGDAHHFRTATILKDVRILAVDQTSESKDAKTVVGRTATLELAPAQVEMVERARASGTLSLALRALGDNETANAATSPQHGPNDGSNEIDVIRYGVDRPSIVGAKE